jgi:pseudouridine-5'-phosphate glycosidase
VATVEVARAIRDGAPIVALETAVLALGLPYPKNLEVFEAMERAVRDGGAVPATLALDEGHVRVGLPLALVKKLATRTGVLKAARRDIGRILATRATGATTVSATIWLAHRVGLDVAATGGIGGVHVAPAGGPGAGIDVSADIPTLAQTPVLLVSTGVKSICDAVATGELLETFSVPVIGLCTERFPHFYGGPSPLPVPRIATPAEAARTFLLHRLSGGSAAVLVVNPAPAQLDPVELARLTRRGMARAARDGILGQALTPFLLEFLARETKGRTVRANFELLVANARLAGQIAVELVR